jgi:Tol biopolymer transport system component
MNLARGTRLGPYEVIAALGAGGMGQVYRATDTRLRRDVAIKFVAERWQDKPDLRALFLIEAEAIATLNHPNICQIYDVGTHGDNHFIVMEVVDGETLAARLTRGPLPIEQACRVAAEIAGALGAAHRAGIVHRDIKPANVILSRDGAKLLDFGLAQLVRPAARPAPMESTMGPGDLDVPQSPAGTWHYMSPEQTRGEATDARSDVFALGALMYEIVAGRRAFEGATHQELVAAILAADPVPLETVATGVPGNYARIVRICLSAAPQDRWNSAADVRRALDASPHDIRESSARPRRRAARSLVVAAALAVAFIAGLFIRSAAPPIPDRRLVRSTIELGRFAIAGAMGSIVFTPDGKFIIYEGRDEPPDGGNAQRGARLYRYSLAAGTLEPIPGTEGARSPFVSPDGRWLGFEAELKFKKMPINGGQPVTISASNFSGVSWGDDGYLVFGGPAYSGLRRVSADGGDVTVLTTPRPEDAKKDHRYPIVLPGSRAVLYGVGTGKSKDARIVAEDLRTGVRTDLVTGTMTFRYSPSGQIIYALDGALYGQRFDVSALAMVGTPVKIADGVLDFSGPAEFAVSDSGDLVFVPGTPEGPVDEMVLVTTSGEVTSIGQPGLFEKPRFSPDGTLISVIRTMTTSERNVWIYDVRRKTFGPATFDAYLDAIWDMDGGLTLTRGRPSLSKLVSRSLGTNPVETELTKEIKAAELPIAWIDGGRRLLFERHSPGTISDIWSVRPGKDAERFLTTPFSKNRTSVSPDGRWLTYTSAEAGEPQVYLQQLDMKSPRVQVSRKRGFLGAWSPNSRRFYFHGPAGDGEGSALWAVDVDGGANPSISEAVELFKIPEIFGHFDMSPDGKAFVMIRHLDTPNRSLRLVQNWPAALESSVK